MGKRAGWICAGVVLLVCCRAYGDIAAIRAADLPQGTEVLAALDEARQLEPYSHAFTDKWQYPVPKDEVATRLGKDLGFLRAAVREHPDNAELQLLIGLVARYAYNLDVEGSYDAAMGGFDEAAKLIPGDFRPSWFRATLLCQTSQPDKGGEGFLAIENSHPWNKLPAAFWDDYLECATVTSMPAHALRAVDHLKALNAPESQMRSYLAGGAEKRFDAFDPNRKYEPKDAWWARPLGDEMEFTSTSCGIRLRTKASWGVEAIRLENGSCVADFITGHYAGKKYTNPSVLVMVQRPAAGETLEDYAKKFVKNGMFLPFTPARCPAEDCVALRAIQPEMYKEDGGGRGRVVVFEREEPEFPGLIFEFPMGPPKPDEKSGMQYYRPSQIQRRIPGKLYYLVLLDTSASVEQPALADFDFLLKNLTVD